MGAHRFLRRLADGLLAVVLAPPCAACGRPLDDPAGAVVCAGCWGAIRLLEPPWCGVCGDPLRSWRDAAPGDRCGRCRQRASPITAGRALGDYAGALRAIVHALKYDGRTSLAASLGDLMRTDAAPLLAGADAAVPVPLHWLKHWRRGFNQSFALAARLGVPVVPALVRRRWTRSQTGLSAPARAANVRHAFALHRRHPVRGLTIVLVDDVRTTGETLEACAGVLLDGGAREVRALTAARVATAPPPARPR